jgi:hypothetical protein
MLHVYIHSLFSTNLNTSLIIHYSNDIIHHFIKIIKENSKRNNNILKSLHTFEIKISYNHYNIIK